MNNLKHTKCTCNKCGHIWMSRTENPKACPACKRYDWNKENKVND